MTMLSVNVNKIATLRNARGEDTPNVVQIAIDCERFGADGITVHPRPDERHITKQDVYDLAKAYNRFYAECSIFKEDDQEKVSLRIQISGQVAKVIKKGMNLLGANVPDKM